MFIFPFGNFQVQTLKNYNCKVLKSSLLGFVLLNAQTSTVKSSSYVSFCTLIGPSVFKPLFSVMKIFIGVVKVSLPYIERFCS